jgi:hypothetical protein
LGQECDRENREKIVAQEKKARSAQTTNAPDVMPGRGVGILFRGTWAAKVPLFGVRRFNAAFFGTCHRIKESGDKSPHSKKSRVRFSARSRCKDVGPADSPFSHPPGQTHGDLFAQRFLGC